MTPPLVMTEHTAEVFELPEQVASAFGATKAVGVTPAGRGRWRLAATRRVGAVSVGDVTLVIRPKVTVARLLFLLGYADNPDGWRDDPVGLREDDELWPAMAHLFVRAAEQALRGGVLHGYRVVDSTLNMVRGRIREHDQVRLRFGLAVPLEVRYDEFDADIPENRLLRAATKRLLTLEPQGHDVARRLRHLTSRLGEVGELVAGEPLPQTPASRLTARYQPALAMARLVLSGESVDVTAGGVRATGFFFDMDKIFESFVTRALVEAFAPYGGRFLAQPQGLTVDEAGRLTMRPDLIRLAEGGGAVIDAKYKTKNPVEDVYQVLAYCTVLGIDRGDLVYAFAPPEPVRHEIRHSRVRIVRHGLDLSLQPPDLLRQVAGIARDIAHREVPISPS